MAAASTSTPWSRREDRSGETALFGEGPGGFLVSGERSKLEGLASEELELFVIGEVGGETLEIEAAEQSMSIQLDDAEMAWGSLSERAEAPI